MNKFIFLLALSLITHMALAHTSRMTGAYIPYGNYVFDSYPEHPILESELESAVNSIGESCIETEHYRYEEGLNYNVIELLERSFTSEGWRVEKLGQMKPSSHWLIWKNNKAILVFFTFVHRDLAYVSLCRIV
ncbi:hypothetical protein Mlute_02678 [Meiothermus luteus]|jgi:hypothetical protein|uniref:Uncharacterized protein n=1 Tax=Meiothermus luteus TaxID=2026184 RepID=A0A399EHP2_9DEIN|nr:hypothetical protein [Meiothermus luteus]RIH81832.1 hypothetical protein Mlute_02678 [Meiothermus luteus]RMH57549.1 MAG: hypothetical protein D6684_03255 [Deinococcota bacterium]